MNRKNTKLLADLCHWTKVLGMGTKKKKSEIPIFTTSTRGRKKESTKKKNQKKNTTKSGVEK